MGVCPQCQTVLCLTDEHYVAMPRQHVAAFGAKTTDCVRPWIVYEFILQIWNGIDDCWFNLPLSLILQWVVVLKCFVLLQAFGAFLMNSASFHQIFALRLDFVCRHLFRGGVDFVVLPRRFTAEFNHWQVEARFCMRVKTCLTFCSICTFPEQEANKLVGRH